MELTIARYEVLNLGTSLKLRHPRARIGLVRWQRMGTGRAVKLRYR